MLALAPDAATVKAGQGQAAPNRWSGLGVCAEPPAVWGLCQGSGKQPYQVTVDLTETAYRCSCPSRKQPCKHVVGLLLLWSDGKVEGAEQPAEFAAQWLSDRAVRAAKAAERRAAPVADPTAALRRAQQRDGKVGAGLDELDRWLADQVRTGLAGTERTGYAHFSQVAARMVDAQASGVAADLKRLPGVAASGEGWAGRLLAAYARLHLLIAAHRRIESLPEPLAATVRAHLGYPVAKEEVLALPPVRDRWSVLARRDDVDEKIRTRRVWLRGVETGRDALVLSFAAPGQSLDDSLPSGLTLDADLHFYPGARPLRALVGQRHADVDDFVRPAAGALDEALAGYAAARAADPWVAGWPALVTAVPTATERGWVLAGDDGALPLRPNRAAEGPWRLVAVAGGRPVAVFGEWDGATFDAMAAVRERSVVEL